MLEDFKLMLVVFIYETFLPLFSHMRSQRIKHASYIKSCLYIDIQIHPKKYIQTCYECQKQFKHPGLHPHMHHSLTGRSSRALMTSAGLLTDALFFFLSAFLPASAAAADAFQPAVNI